MTRQTAPQRSGPGASERRRHLEMAKERQAERHRRVIAETPPPPRPPRGWRGFVKRYGWRAYALPLLVVVSIVAIFSSNSGGGARHAATAAPPTTAAGKAAAGNGNNGSGGTGNGAAVTTPTATTPPVAASDGQLKADTPGPNSDTEGLASDALPPGAPYTTTGTGTFATIPGTSAVFGSGPLRKFSIEVENGVTGVDLNKFASVVMATLSDPRSWIAGKNVSLQRVDSGAVAFHITLTSSMTVRTLCGYDVQIETSCFAPNHDDRVVLNVARWVRGDTAYIGDLALYQQYMVNHETGHALGHSHAHQCLASGLAPVMMQQTIGTKTASGQICSANPWPYPTGETDAPGAEQSAASADNAFIQLNS